MIHGIHSALRFLAVLTAVSTLVFWSLRPGDGQTISNQKVLPQHHPGG